MKRSKATNCRSGHPIVAQCRYSTQSAIERTGVHYEEKAEKKKQQTRAASKTYRQKKKAHISELLQRVEKLESDNRALLERLSAYEEAIHKLNTENQRLRYAQLSQAATLERKTFEHLQLFERQLLQGAPDHVLYQTVQQLKSLCGDFNTQQMYNMNFNNSGKSQDFGKVIENIKNLFPEMTTEQLEDLRDLEDEHQHMCTEIRSERTVLVDALHMFPNGTSPERVARLSSSLEKSYIHEDEQWNYSMKELNTILTPKQIVKLECWISAGNFM